MSQTSCVSDAVADVAAMIKDGKLPQAKRTMALLLDNVHPSVLALLNECAAILSRPSPVARPKLTALWHQYTANPEAQQIIAACAPARDEWDHRTVPELPATDYPNHANTPNAGPVETRTGTPVSRAELRARRDRRQAHKDAAGYFADRAGVDDQPRRGDQPDAYRIDYDRAAIPALRGTPCVCCWLERSHADHATGRSDDGLCSDCRERQRPGIPDLPVGHTRADAITARCALIAVKYHASTARAILRNEWYRAQTARDRATITAWVQANSTTVDAPAEPTRTQTTAQCGTCGSTRQVRDSQCVDCRSLNTEPAPRPASNADTNDAHRTHAAAVDPASPAAPRTSTTDAHRYQRRHRQALPPGTVYVGRPTRYGNPFRCEPTPAGRAEAVRQYRQWICTQPDLIERARVELTGHTLACWCPTDGPCHADVLLELIAAPAAAAA